MLKFLKSVGKKPEAILKLISSLPFNAYITSLYTSSPHTYTHTLSQTIHTNALLSKLNWRTFNDVFFRFLDMSFFFVICWNIHLRLILVRTLLSLLTKINNEMSQYMIDFSWILIASVQTIIIWKKRSIKSKVLQIISMLMSKLYRTQRRWLTSEWLYVLHLFISVSLILTSLIQSYLFIYLFIHFVFWLKTWSQSV
jgi:hypothetical protein